MTERRRECPQTLHGYDRGHHLLASGGDLREEELRELDRLSDLSGYLPADAAFEAYHTGFPCGRYYALACTWPDRDAPRRGTVLTHTLLIPRATWAHDPDPFGWLEVHRRPVDAGDLGPYRGLAKAPAVDSAAASTPTPPLRDDELYALIWLWYGQPARPLLWVEDPPPLRIVRALWPWLWPEARGEFAFCTFALQARSLSRRPFDLLGIPTVALGAFHELRQSPAWWLHERLRAPRAPENWIEALVERGPEAVAAILTELDAEGLSAPANAGLLRAAQRYLELEEGARIRLPAARARLDMLGRVWSDLDEEHPAVVAAIQRLLEHQRDAPLEPRALWDLNYLLDQAFVRRHLRRESPVGDEIRVCVEGEVERRLRAVGEALTEELAQLYETVSEARGAIRAGLRAALPVLAESEDEDGLDAFVILLDLAADLGDRPLERVLFHSLPLDLLSAWVECRTAQGSPSEQAAREAIVDHARGRMAPRLAFAAWSGDPRRGLIAAASVVDEHPHTRPEFEGLLREQTPEEQLEWCLTLQHRQLDDLAARLGAEIVRALKPDLRRLAALCDKRSFGPAIFAAVGPWARDADLTAVFADFPSLARGLIRDAMDGPPTSMSAAALRLLPAPLLWEQDLLVGLAAHSPARPFVGNLVKRLIGDVVTAQLEPRDAAVWFTAPHVLDWLEHATNWEIEDALWRGRTERGVRLLCATIVAIAAPRFGVVRPLLLALPNAGRDAIEQQVEPLLTVLAHLDADDSTGVLVRAEVLGTLRYLRFPDAWRLVEECFYPAYRAAGTEQRVFEQITWWGLYSPDRQRYWRHWLLETWIHEEWPRGAFLSCLGEDRKLARRVFKRARKKSGATREWLWSLEPEFRKHVTLYQVWRDVV